MKAPKITFTSALRSLSRAVKARGEDYRYKEPGDGRVCFYFEPHNGAKSCGVGWVLADHGFDLNTIGSNNEGATPTMLMEFGVIRASGKTLRLLEDFQTAQDNGTPWGKAFVDAVEHATSREFD